MNFKSYSRLNNIIGWLVFAIAAFTYLMTIEHTVSLWDCGEFTSCARRLEVPHPPGAPFHLITYRIFSMLAGGNEKMVPIFTNSASALNSAFCILFLFWSITALAMKMLVKDKENMNKSDVYAIFGAGIVGALAYTFSDTFWFSAVESEVYAMSSMLTALVFWLVMKWEARSDQPNNLKWLVLIFYMIGIVIGVHLLGLLVIPTIFIVYYYKKYPKVTWQGLSLAILIGLVALGTVQIVIIQWMPTIGAWFDRFFVNSFGMPFWSGVLFFYFVIFLICGYFIWYSHQRKLVILNTALLCFVSVIIGYTSYAICPIRSFANPAIDMNDTQDVDNFLGYLGRDQYGDNYLVSGPYYTAFTQKGYEEGAYQTEPGAQLWRTDKKNHKYVENGHKTSLNFPNPKYKTFFPRMASQGDNYTQGYRYWGNVKNENRLSFVKNNLVYFFSYQINYMYFRYFAWNFIGRQNDMQGEMNEFFRGNWITGIPFIDNGILHTGPAKDQPFYMAANKAKNKLFALPFILGILGMIYQYKRNRKDFFTVFFFFFMTGLAIEIYLNMPSPQPRERDYAFVGSFYVFAFWIGFGVLWLYELIKSRAANMSGTTVAILATGISVVAVPALMAGQEWDDHDRSHRTASLDYAIDYLQSCAPHAILFTNGDNDTYPLWYAQEVEHIRDDVRIVNLSLFGTDSYINQMREPVNNAAGLPFTLNTDQTIGWEVLRYYDNKKYDQTQYVDLKNILAFIADQKDINNTKLPADDDGFRSPFLPTRKIKIMVDKQAVMNSQTVPASDYANIADEMDIDIHKNNFYKSDMMLLDFIMTNNWKYPVYFSITSGPDEYLGLGRFLQQEGLTYRLVPVKNPAQVAKGQDDKRMNVDIMYNNIMTKFQWGGLDKGETFMDYVLGRQSENIRGVMASLAAELINANKKDSAVKIADLCQKAIPEENVPVTNPMYMDQLVDVYYRAGAKDKAQKLADHMRSRLSEELNYYSEAGQANHRYDNDLHGWRKIELAQRGLNVLLGVARQNKDEDMAKKIQPLVDMYNQKYPPEQQQGPNGGQDDGSGEDQ